MSIIYISKSKWQRNIVQRCASYGSSWLHSIARLHSRYITLHYILAWLLFGQWQHARGLSVQRAISKRSPWRTTRKSAAQLNPEIMPIQKVHISVPLRMDQQPNWPLLQGPPARSHTLRLQMDHWLCVTPVSVILRHPAPTQWPIIQRNSLRSVGRHRGQMMIGRKSFTARVKPFF